MSTAIASPSSSRATSWGTSSVAANDLPDAVSKHGHALGHVWAGASTARPAWSSCMNANAASSRITSTTAMPTVRLSTMNDSNAATHSSNASGWVS
jgi:hypothetical protein